MNKSVAFMWAGIVSIGLLIVARSTFPTIADGHGDFKAGNFNRCRYSITRNAQTGKGVRQWDIIQAAEFGFSGELRNISP